MYQRFEINQKWNEGTAFIKRMKTQYKYGIKYCHYNDVMINAMASAITSLTSVYSTVYSGADQRKP